jgi:hypothetical protein
MAWTFDSISSYKKNLAFAYPNDSDILSSSFNITYINNTVTGPSGLFLDDKKISYNSNSNLMTIYVEKGEPSSVYHNQIWSKNISDLQENILNNLIANENFFITNKSYPVPVLDDIILYTLNISYIGNGQITTHESTWYSLFSGERESHIPNILYRIADAIEDLAKPTIPSLTVQTNKQEYGRSEPVNITIRNNGNETLTFSDTLLGLSIRNIDRNEIVDTGLIGASVVTELMPKETHSIMWDQKAVSGSYIQPGKYQINIRTAPFIDPQVVSDTQFTVIPQIPR